MSESLHSKIEQQLVITSNAKNGAEKFVDWVLSPAAQEIIINAGYRGIDAND
jgi:ABC-type molybdate transport system substrate-binding protein